MIRAGEAKSLDAKGAKLATFREVEQNNSNRRSRFPKGITERKASATADPYGMTARKTRATTTEN
jgi:hypothetical protein